MRSLLSSEARNNPTATTTRRRPGDDRDDDDSSDSDGAAKARFRKQVQKLVLDPVPQASGFRQWVLAMQVAIIASSRRPRLRTLRWIRSVADATSLADVEHVGAKWDDLDAELADCILRIAAGPLKRKLVLYHEAYQDGQTLEAWLPCGMSFSDFAWRRARLCALTSPH